MKPAAMKIVNKPGKAVEIYTQLWTTAAKKNPAAVTPQTGKLGLMGEGIEGERNHSLTDEYRGRGVRSKVMPIKICWKNDL